MPTELSKKSKYINTVYIQQNLTKKIPYKMRKQQMLVSAAVKRTAKFSKNANDTYMYM